MINKKYLTKLRENNIDIQDKDLNNRSSITAPKKLTNYDIKNVIYISHYLMKKNLKGKIMPKDINLYLETDYWIRNASWFLIRKIEEKLTAAMQTKIAFNDSYGEDYYLKISNFKSESKGSIRKQIKYKKELSQFMNLLKNTQHSILFKKPDSYIQKNSYVPFSDLLSELSYTNKYKLLKFMTIDVKREIFKSFGSSSNDITWIFSQIRIFRNQAAHHGLVINQAFKKEDGAKSSALSLGELLKYMSELASPIETRKFKKILSTIDSKDIKEVLCNLGIL